LVNPWPSVVHRARLTGQAALKTWPLLAHRARPSAKLLGEVVLGVLLVAALAFSPRDGVPTDDYVWPAQSVFHVQPSLVEQPQLGLTLPDLRSLSDLARAGGQSISAKALTPTARPVQILIPALDVHRPVEVVGVNRSGVMNVPVNAWNAGWYNGGSIPGAPGDAVIEGHAGYPDQPMIFSKLATLRRGDQIVVVLADGSRRLFLVDSMANVPVGAPVPGLAEPYGPPRLTLVTCSGHFDAKSYTYSMRLVVEASYAGIV
jgi:sortase (surface protein transpeptidase)